MAGKIFKCLLLAAVLLTSGCKESVRDFRVNTYSITAIEPSGLKGVKVYLDLNVHNPVVGFTLLEPRGLVKFDGKPCLALSTNDIMLKQRGDQDINLCVGGELVEGFSPVALLGLMNGRGLENITADVTTRVRLNGGLGKKIDLRDLPVGKMIKK